MAMVEDDFRDGFDEDPVLQPDQPSGFVEPTTGYTVPRRTFETKPPRKMSAYCDFPVDVDDFFQWQPQFNNAAKYPAELVVSCYKKAALYVPKFAQCDQLDGADRNYARALMCAHLIVLQQKAEALANADSPTGGGMGGISTPGQLGTVGQITSASVGGVSVGAQLPQSANAWEFWLNQTPYGLEFQAFLSSKVPVGVYAMGDDLRACFRD